MADNNFKDTNSIGDNRLLSNPYAPKSGLVMKVSKIDYCNYLASVGYVVAPGGATTTITPITGNLNAGLEYYRVEIKDETGECAVANSLDLANRSTPFVIDTSALDISSPWTLFFFGASQEVSGDVPCELKYKKALGVIGIAGGSGDTIPASWTNVTVRLRLQNTNDPAFTAFPAEGVIIENGGTININDYTTDVSGLLVNLSDYEFYLDIKKIGTDPIAATPTPASNATWSSFASTVTFPYAITLDYAEALNLLTLDTSASGATSGVMTISLTNEGVVPEFSFTIATEIA